MSDQELDRVRKSLRDALNFASLHDDVLSELAERSRTRSCPAGTLVFEKGSAADGLYVVSSGKVRIFDRIRGRDTAVAMIGPGDFFGEISLALRTTRTRAAEATEDTELVVIPLEAVKWLERSYPALASHLIEAFEERIGRREQLGD